MSTKMSIDYQLKVISTQHIRFAGSVSALVFLKGLRTKLILCQATSPGQKRGFVRTALFS